jgi:PEP-CTERM motif
MKTQIAMLARTLVKTTAHVALLFCIFASLAHAGDIIKVKSDGTSKTITNGGFGSVTGNVTKIDAYARVLTPVEKFKTNLPYDGTFPDTVGPVTDSGTRYTTTAVTTINVTTRAKYASWNSTGSSATMTDNKAKASETYEARSFVKDPMTLSLQPGSNAVTFGLDLGTSMSLQIDPHIPANEFWSASLSGYADTSLNNLGMLWSWSWSIDSKNPTDAVFAFHSNPLLGLNDTAIDGEFNSLAMYDGSTGLHSLSSPFSVSVDVNVLPGQDSYTFGGEQNIDIQGGVAPEPNSLLLLGSGILGLAGVLRKRLLT